jgi:hypothetical protein
MRTEARQKEQNNMKVEIVQLRRKLRELKIPQIIRSQDPLTKSVSERERKNYLGKIREKPRADFSRDNMEEQEEEAVIIQGSQVV